MFSRRRTSRVKKVYTPKGEIPMGRIHKLRLAQKIAFGLATAAAAATSFFLLRRHFQKPAKPNTPPIVEKQKPRTMPASRLVPRKQF